MLGLRRKLSVPMFAVGLGLITSGILWEITAVWVVGIALFVVGLGVLARGKRRF